MGVFSTCSCKIVPILVYGIVVWNCFTGFGIHAQLLPQDEVRSLQAISKALKLENIWNVSETSCNRIAEDFNVTKVAAKTSVLGNVTCVCSSQNSSVCHVKTIQLKGLNLTGDLPAEFGNLTSLEELDLTRNSISGSIPASLSRAPLRILSLLGNRLTGTIPKEIGDISTLRVLVLEQNQLGGSLPEEIGNLRNLERLVLSANNFTGTIPPTLGNLKNLTDFRIDGNKITGSIPSFIGNWTKLDRLDMQGTSMEGPIPSNISLLSNLVQLRISDLTGPVMTFPDLKNVTKLKRLILRNCSLTGSIPGFIGQNMTDLNTLDLSFNNLTGEIPDTLKSLGTGKQKHVFLTNNSLSKVDWSWITNGERNWDLSYNNFTERPSSVDCTFLNLNLVSSYSSFETQSWCLTKDLPCPETQRHKSLFINCGGDSLSHNGNQYEQDKRPDGISNFVSVNQKWGYSSTGVYMDDEDNQSPDFLPTNIFSLKTDAEIYNTARIAPLSLKYYGLCLQKGRYKVQLHFAEIMFTDNQTFSSWGRRIFDVSIQGNVVLKDYNIVERAGGVGKSVTETFDATVHGSTLEIHLYWVGKGTSAIPYAGVYGPLISAITITKIEGQGLSVGAIIGIVAASCVLVILILLVLRITGYLGGKQNEDPELRGIDLQTGRFTLRQMKAATHNFDPANKIGEGGFGPVYKGVLSDGGVIAVKQLSAKSKQGNREFINEVGMISALEHPNLVRLYGCCIEGNQLLLVYEYMENNSLASALFGNEEKTIRLDWPTRKKICLGVARGLAYLHEESRLKIVHRDIKATNVLLDKNLNAKISDFGLAKLDEEENTHISTRIAGTIGYMAPEYATRGYLTDKADVYSFGIVALEIVSGKSNTSYRPKEEFTYLLDWAYVLQERGKLLDLVDPSLGSNYSKEEALTMLNLGLLCTNTSPSLRPTMTSVVSMLEQKTPVPEQIMRRISVEQDARLRAFEKLSQDSMTQSSTVSHDSHQIGISMDGPWVDSSFSIQSKDDRHENSSTSKLL
ncbi:probable LRR receptor-like serine/threonine-protein kinase At1g53430 [Ziziphus jujuba]|uniref:non-specific serine/threonine protein kinase n=1 Tax=Ziziphus jujuba TaxID=326968 RepID=A0ABM3ZVW5_ZIZJJ|nr:probable LRR receptor-like serine/threonine-protein kinase At1g53430 [Ziziphus jujuba]XP_060668622.1 probable LRR receptor-like serine/threonine-protein kinase At1g53430 [Ziziphus jujuba]XP_060668623.1 probable LRR receptor-like serine/threonine-protein kinase At1g53430 [Ziziphus jujuba]XP_060668624.1 probable LRR receptor-like serine/threonine-protein kinase At1g53430 [Ziziphus jujuba]